MKVQAFLTSLAEPPGDLQVVRRRGTVAAVDERDPHSMGCLK